MPGNITNSDHLLIIQELATNPVSIPITPRFDYKKANWNRFKKLLEDKLLDDLNGRPTLDIDQETD